LHYRVGGRGECVLLIHGLGSSGADWELQARALQQQFRVIAPDLPGSGNSTPLQGDCSIARFAATLWTLLDHLRVTRVNVVGFSLGGAVALEMALQRPDSVPRLALINSLATYRIDHWCKWLEARVPPVLVGMFGMRRMAGMIARRLFPRRWQRPLRQRATAVLSSVRAGCYAAMALALEAWSSIDRLHHLKSRALVIAAEHDYTPLAEKYALAAALRADIVVVRGSRHGTPFDSTEATNAALLAPLTDQPLPAPGRCVCDGPEALQKITPSCDLAEHQQRAAPARTARGRRRRSVAGGSVVTAAGR
jgi:pimeloyl-ACP methyl ester carboxylesterase